MREPKYKGRTIAELEQSLGFHGAHNYISFLEPDHLSVDEVVAAIVPKPCGRLINPKAHSYTCGDQELRCSSHRTIGDRLVDDAYTSVTDARDGETIMERAFASLTWNLSLAALLALARRT
jgi:hypothetical protein